MRMRVNAAVLMALALAVAAAGCHHWNDWHDDRGLELDARIESVDGAETLRHVRFGVDDEWREAGFGDRQDRITLYGRFEGGRGPHTVRVAVTSQTSSPQRYRVSGTLRYVEADGLFSWRTLSSVRLPEEVRTFETDETVRYTVEIP